MVEVYGGATFDISCYAGTSVPKPHLRSLEDSLAIKQIEVTVVL